MVPLATLARRVDRRFLAAAALLLVGAAVWSARRAAPIQPTAVAPAVSAGSKVAALSSVEIAQKTKAAEVIVAANNAEATQHAKAFLDDGWTFVEAAPPDPALISASPTLIPNREPELRAQLASAPPDKKYLSNVSTVATDARDASTRVAAVEAIGRMGQGDPQHALVNVMKKLTGADPARRVAVALIRPLNTADPFVIAMAALLDDPVVSADERKQLAMTLSLVALREGVSLPADVLESMSPTARALIASTTQLARTPGN